MSDSRIDYQSIHTEEPDSPTYHRFAIPPDTPGHKYPSRNQAVDEDDGGHATETQRLLHERDSVDIHAREPDHDYEDDHDEAGATMEANRSDKIQAFFCVALLGVSTNFTKHMTGPLKDVLKENMDINNTQFSMLQSSLTLFPSLTPLIGGLLVERYGTGPISIIFTSIVVLGQMIVVLGCWIHSIKSMLVGFCLFGLGEAPVGIVRKTILMIYFKKDGTALVMALGLISGKVAGFLALATSVPLTTLPPFGFVTPFLVSLAVSIFAWFMNIIFLMFQKKPKEGAGTMAKITILLKSKRTNIGWREIYKFSTMFWTLLTISLFVGASWSPFIHQASNIIKRRYGLTDEQAAWQSSLILAVPPFIFPFIGTFIDYTGKRAWLLLATAGCIIITHVILLIPLSIVPIPPTIMLIFSLSLSLGTLSIITSMPLLTKHFPTGLGLHGSIDNVGATLFGTVIGMVQDLSGNSQNLSGNSQDEASEQGNLFPRVYRYLFSIQGDPQKEEREDVQVLAMFLSVGIALFIASAIFVWGDYHWTDGEGGKTGLANSVYGNSQSNQRTTRSRRRRRRSHEVLEAMTLEPIFDLANEPDAEEISMMEIGSNNPGLQSSNQQGSVIDMSNHRDDHGQRHRHLQPRRDYNPVQAESSDDDEESQDENRFGVQIEAGDDDIPRHKVVQARFWITVWVTLLVVSWVVFGIGMSR
ncbi:hypothetical protein BGZ65_011391 [Modicella reniformis]|uniref:Lysosomal dipeptide transporter MFSD1 n=1 Tax=Modicella reniformis TaxID=1440133 RepID=A0A9P6SV36_9FUNG|nr:hypothetical protein BGZ65_011391 [Modicella reniformis]